MDNRTPEQKENEKQYVRSLLPQATIQPNWVMDNIRPLLTPNERCVLDVVYRQTYGFEKIRDEISIEQFRKGIVVDGVARAGTMLGRNAVIAAINSLIKTRVIIRTKKSAKKDIGYSAHEYMAQMFESNIDIQWLTDRRDKKEAIKLKKGSSLTAAKSAKNKHDEFYFDEDDDPFE